MTEPKVERIRAAVRDKLAAIDASTSYFYTPEVIEVEGFWRAHFDGARSDTLYQVRMGENRSEEETSRTYAEELELWLMLAHKYNPSSEDPHNFPASVNFAHVIQARMMSDVKMALLSGDGFMLGGLTENLEIPNANPEVYLDGWVLVELRVVAKFQRHRDEA
jgi:hypothetical protein